MKVSFVAIGCCLMMAIAGCSSSTSGSSGGNSSSANRILGKWLPQQGNTPKGSYVEFTTDGKMMVYLNFGGSMKGQELRTYKVDGDKLILTSQKKDGSDDTEPNTIKTLNDDDLVFVNPVGTELKFKRLK